MARKSCLFWIKFFIWVAVTTGLGRLLSILVINPVLSLTFGAVIASPVLFADYIVRYFVDKNKTRKTTESGVKQVVLKSLGDDVFKVVLCPNCAKENLLGTTHCNNCGKDLRAKT